MKKACVLLVLAVWVPRLLAEEEIDSLWSVGPRIGFSTISGLYAVEVQRDALAVSLGGHYHSDEYYLALRHHFRPRASGWFVAAGVNIDGDSGSVEVRSGPMESTVYREDSIAAGVMGGYSWRLDNGCDLSCGIGYGHEWENSEADEFDDDRPVWFIELITLTKQFGL